METLLLDPQSLDRDSLAGGATTVVAVPFKFRDGRNPFVVAVIHVRSAKGSDAAIRSGSHSAQADMTRAYAAAMSDAAARTPPNSEDAATVYGSLAGIVSPRTRRSSAAYLAAWSGAVLRRCDPFLRRNGHGRTCE